ncbi:unnamed protein product [Cylindrotheca closterium]|uniref:Uncharacterized protein n=1 Tax=Cylindrotheca closterium TaxID=2856 RepID=A0AAD2JMF4_9STRA|nr:unnamed protein product [Cylindrotheca closterium]
MFRIRVGVVGSSSLTSALDPMDFHDTSNSIEEHHRTMFNQQSECNGNGDGWERRIPLRIGGDEISGRRQEWPGQSHFVADGFASSWMDNLFLLERNSLERPDDLTPNCHRSGGEAKRKRESLDLTDVERDKEFLLQDNIFEALNDLAPDFHRSGSLEEENHRGKGKRQRLALHSDLTDVERTPHKQRERIVAKDSPANTPLSAECSQNNDVANYRKQYPNLMFSPFSIKRWGHESGSWSPCHLINLVKEPTLLTMTSFPFRIIFANDAFLRLRRNDNNFIGVSLFDCFVSDELENKAHDLCRAQPFLASLSQLSRAKSFLASLLDDAGCLMRMVAAEDSETVTTLPCVVNAYPVVSNGKGRAEDISYYAMCFDDIQHDRVEISRQG